jgi:hypothetical protein
MASKRSIFIRNMRAFSYIEVFILASVATILAFRSILDLTGYPSVSSDKLHIAHMLPGGILMMISILSSLVLLGRSSNYFGAILGGIGFGAFIDEIGKFMTKDYNYFYKPTVAIIYVIFIISFLSIRTLFKRRHYSQIEYLMNAIHELEEVALDDLDEDEKQQVIEYLENCDQDEPLVKNLSGFLKHAKVTPSSTPLFVKVKDFFRILYRRIVYTFWFRVAIILFCTFQLLANFFNIFGLILVRYGNPSVAQNTLLNMFFNSNLQTMTLIDWAQLLSSLISAIFVLWGLLNFMKSRLSAYRMFERSILVSIFLTQVFVFYNEQFSGLIGLCIYLLVYVALRFMIERERHLLLVATQTLDPVQSM